ncbi:MAG TPA: hypothetical protein VHB97_10850 [Polyangia bacterium]|jgi:hypothetical protein|nr:hypothetical protein [Polyangia bacterium]
MAADDIDPQRARLARLADELRAAAIAALGVRSWFTPTLDDCRVDVERLLAAPDGDDGALERHAVILRSGLALRTWQHIFAVKRRGDGARRCMICGGGPLVDVAGAGRSVPFRGVDVELPADLVIATCDRCGAESLDAATAAQLDAVLFSAYATTRR